MVRDEAHKLLRSALLQNGIPAEEQLFTSNEYGKPQLKKECGVHFNISHCRQLAVCAVSDRTVGADAEKLRKYPERVLKRSFTEREADYVRNSSDPDMAFFQLWTLKESFVKAIGTGLSYPLDKAEFIIDNNYITSHTESGHTFSQIIIDKEFICSICSSNILNNKVYYESFEEIISVDSLI